MAKRNTKHAYKQAPWRIKLRSFTWIILLAVCFLIVSAFRLNVSSNSYSVGLEIQYLEDVKDNTILQVADLQNQLAMITSSEEMRSRLEELGYSRIESTNELEYLLVPGYTEEEFAFQQTQKEDPNQQTLLKPIYSQSLWELLVTGNITFGAKGERNIQ